MKVLLINVIDEKDKVQTQYPSLGLGYIATYTKKYVKQPINIKIIDSKAEREIEEFKPDIVGLSAVSENFKKAKRIAKFCKDKGIIVMIGKSHITSVPSCLDENMDVGVLGEGEETFKELIELYIDKKRFKHEDLETIKGIVFHRDGKLIITEKREFIKELDSIPSPDTELLNIKKGDEVHIFASRGCPYKCVFCFSSKYWGAARFFSAKYVVNEIRSLYEKYKPPRINLFDDLFIADKERLRKIVKLSKNESYYKKVRFTITVRANLVNEEISGLLKELNVDIVNMGLESGNDRVLTYLKGGSVTVQDNKDAIECLKKCGLEVSASFIIGSPSETKEEVLDTLQFIKSSKLDLFEIYLLTPFPGTPVWDYALKKGLVSDDMDWDRLKIDFLQHYDKAVMLSEKMSRNEIKELHNLFLWEYKKRYIKLMVKAAFTRPKDIIPFIKKRIFQTRKTR